MAFPKSRKITGESVIMILVVKLFSLTQLINNIIQKTLIKATPLHQLIAFLISCGKFQLVYHASSAAFSSSILRYPLTSGSRDMRLASAIASSVL